MSNSIKKNITNTVTVNQEANKTSWFYGPSSGGLSGLVTDLYEVNAREQKLTVFCDSMTREKNV